MTKIPEIILTLVVKLDFYVLSLGVDDNEEMPTMRIFTTIIHGI